MAVTSVQGPLTRTLIDSVTRANQDHLDLWDESKRSARDAVRQADKCPLKDKWTLAKMDFEI
jgi:hypothetical protein